MDEQIHLLEIAKLITSPYQGRFIESAQNDPAVPVYTGIEELAASIEKSGLFQPIIVRPSGENYEIIDGHRRVEAYKLLNKTQIEAIVKEMDDKKAQIMSVVVNLQRKDLKMIELAVAYQKMLDNNLFADQKELSKELGKDESYIGQMLNTLKMDSRIIEDLTQQNSVRDLRILRMIRKAAPIGSDGKSDAQWVLFTKVKTENMSRVDFASYLKSQNQLPAQQGWKLTKTRSSIILNVNTKALSKEQIVLLEQAINSKMNEFMQ